MIELFPPTSLDHSILTSVFLGTLLVWALQETLGWGFTGLVVPGYLASVVVIQPRTGLLVVVEAVITYLVVVALSERVPRWWPWTRFFGRDRFFHILLVSAAVRLLLEREGGVLDVVGEVLGVGALGETHAIGLVLVPLVANAIWRTGLDRAAWRIGLPVLAVWAALELVLLRYTNLSLSNFELTYENLALDFTTSTRAQLLLLSGALLASTLNLRWGWDFGGIIVPGLLTLTWLEPTKVAATVGESVVLAAALAVTVRLPGMRQLNLAGGRTLVLCFALDYTLRFTAGWLFPVLATGLSGQDVFGFGYLLTSLLAVRIHRHGDALRVLIPTLVTSFGGFLLWSALGLMLSGLLPGEQAPPAPRLPASAAIHHPMARTLSKVHGGAEATSTFALEALLEAPRPGVHELPGVGAVFDRREHGDLVVVVEVGPLAAVQAAWWLAQQVDARSVLLVRPGADPDRAVGAAGLRQLRVVGGEGPGLTLLSGDIADFSSILPVLGQIAPEVARPVPPALVRLDRRPPTLEVRLDDASRLDLADRLVQDRPAPAPVAHALAPTGPEAELRQRGLEQVLPELVLRPWARWLAGGPDAELALEVALDGASLLELAWAREGDRLDLVGPGWKVESRQGGRPLVVLAPRVFHDPEIDQVAEAFGHGLRPLALVLDAPSPHPTGLTGRSRPALLAVSAALEAAPTAEVIALRGYRDLLDPGEDLVLSLGRPRLPGQPASDVERTARALADTVGLAAADFDGAVERLSFRDTPNAARAAARAAAGEEAEATLWFSNAARRSLSEVEAPGHPLSWLAAEDGLPRTTLTVDALAARVAPDRRAPAAVSRAVDALVDNPRPPRLAALAELGAVSLVCDPELGCRWLLVARCGPARCEGTVAPLHRRQQGPRAVDDTLAALLLQGQDLAVAWEAR